MSSYHYDSAFSHGATAFGSHNIPEVLLEIEAIYEHYIILVKGLLMSVKSALKENKVERFKMFS